MPIKSESAIQRAEPIELVVDGVLWRSAGDDTVCRAGLTLVPGQATLLVGGNGVGKTTWLEKLAGLRPPEGLRIRYGDEPMWLEGRWGHPKLNNRALMRYSYAPQSPENGLFSRTVCEELQFSAKAYRLNATELETRVSAAIGAVGWNEQWLSRDPYRMSGGERRRAALAATFVPPVPWLLLDEPTAGLDGEGHEQLTRYLTGLKDKGSGILFVSHDLDWALPLAETVLILDGEGTIRKCCRDQLLARPEWLVEAGMAIPLWLDIANKLHLRGASASQLWSPVSAAEAAEQGVGVTETVDRRIKVQAVQRSLNPGTLSMLREERQAGQPRHRLGAFDPRTIWLSYILLSLGIFAQDRWSGIAVSGALTLALLAWGRISLWRWRSLLRNYAFFSVIASAFFATGWLSFHTEAFVDTLLPFSRTFLVLLLGLCIPLVMTPLALRNALQKLLTFRKRTPAFAHRLILTVTLMIRFVPVLLTEWGRFARIDLSRGKNKARRSWEIASKMRDMALPFMLSIFRLGDEIAIALESRGVAMDIRPTRAVRLRWNWRDYAAVLGASLLLAGLWVYANR